MDCIAHQAPLSMAFPRQEYWSGLPFPSPGDLPHPGNEPKSPTLTGRSKQGSLPIEYQEPKTKVIGKQKI